MEKEGGGGGGLTDKDIKVTIGGNFSIKLVDIREIGINREEEQFFIKGGDIFSEDRFPLFIKDIRIRFPFRGEGLVTRATNIKGIKSLVNKSEVINRTSVMERGDEITSNTFHHHT